MIALPPRSRKMRTRETGLYSIANGIASVGAGNPRSSAARSSRVRWIASAAWFSRTCATLTAFGMATTPSCSTQARAICAALRCIERLHSLVLDARAGRRRRPLAHWRHHHPGELAICLICHGAGKRLALRHSTGKSHLAGAQTDAGLGAAGMGARLDRTCRHLRIRLGARLAAVIDGRQC